MTVEHGDADPRNRLFRVDGWTRQALEQHQRLPAGRGEDVRADTGEAPVETPDDVDFGLIADAVCDASLVDEE